ncbi:hypothetical protein EDB86DRAFT_3086579 [Lactarius hatsudake]|nr:hypothetical protein EDB86DRAFT_3086579 [Lactarius hatsudake]
MRKPFPVLAHLKVSVSLDDGNAVVLPAEFLGGSAPCLQTIHLRGIPFPALPSLVLSASHLVKLELRSIPPTGYISPEAMVASLAALPRLETFIIQFQSATSRPDRIHPLPITRTVLPSLTYFEFQGAGEYLEDLVARIDGPQLDRISTTYLKSVDIQATQLTKFIDRSVCPRFKLAEFVFYSTEVAFIVYSHASLTHFLAWSSIFFKGIDWQFSDIAQALMQFSAAFSNVDHLRLTTEFNEDRHSEDTDDVEWLQLLRQFSTTQTLHVSAELARRVALALEDIVAEMAAELLPSLDLICVEGQPASSIEKFVTARRVSGRPVTVIDTEIEFDKRLVSYFSKYYAYHTSANVPTSANPERS